MSSLHLVPHHVTSVYEVREWRNAAAVLNGAHPDEWRDILNVLKAFRLRRSEIVVGGGRKTKIADHLDADFTARGWVEKHFDTVITVDQIPIESPTHMVDCYKNNVALEVEWNNKDSVYDRDLNNFRLLFELRAIDVGIIITRRDELQGLFRSLLGNAAANKKYGATTTHMSKLVPKLDGGGGGGCPILVFGIGLAIYDPAG
jgi:hypothetical protein